VLGASRDHPTGQTPSKTTKATGKNVGGIGLELIWRLNVGNNRDDVTLVGNEDDFADCIA
jgi:hypothetical protein